jgi:DNA replication protein DnaD
MKLGTDVELLESKLFFLHIDFETDLDLAKTSKDPLPRNVEAKYNDLVFRARHTAPIENYNGFLIPPLEYFEMTYCLGENFKDHELLHEALEIVIAKRKEKQYKV